MTEPVFLSVVIPLYNKEQSVKRAVQSVLNQTNRYFEVIVVNDGSTDGSLEVVEAIDDDRLKLISQPNAGVSAARNTGVEIARAKYVAFLDADDEWHPQFLDYVLELIHLDPNAGIFSCRYEIIGLNGRRGLGKLSLPDDHRGAVPNFYDHYRRSRSLVCASSVCLNRLALAEIGGFPIGEPVGEDVYVWLAIAERWRVLFDARVASTCYQNAENRTVDRLPPTIPYYLRVMLSSKQQDSALRRLLISYALIYAASAIERGHPEKARQYGDLLLTNSLVYANLCKLIAHVPPAVFRAIKQGRHRIRQSRLSERTAR